MTYIETSKRLIELRDTVLQVRTDPTFKHGAKLRKDETEFLNGAIELARQLVAEPQNT